jgi:hypothetical protein
MQMVRKQLYLGAQHQEKVRRVAAWWGCSEAEVVRRAVERLPDPEGSIEERLAAAGLLLSPPQEDDLPTGKAAEQLEREYFEWVDNLPEPLGLSDAVIEDRR